MTQVSFQSKVAYGLTEFGTQFSWTFIGSYLTVFYTDVVGFAPIVITVMMTIARCIDAFDDPLLGMVAERTRTRWGRFRPWLLWSAPVLAVCNVLTFMVIDVPREAHVVFSLAMYVLCGIAYSAASISVGSLANVMSPEKSDRVSLNVFRGIGGNVASFLIGIATMPMLLWFGDGNAGDPDGYFIVAIIYSAICLVSLAVGFAWVRERVGVPRTHRQVAPLRGLGIVLRDRNVMILIAGMVLFLTGIFGRLGISVYYFMYVLGRPALMSPASGILSISMLLPLAFVPALMKRFDIKTLMTTSCLICALGCTVVFLWGADSIVCVYVGTFILGAGNWVSFCSGPMIAELVDDIQVRTDERVDGTVYSCVSLATKVGNTIGGSCGVLLLAAVGFVPNMVQPDAVRQGMNAVINLVPVFLFIIAGLLFRLMGINNRDSAENARILQERDPAQATAELIALINGDSDRDGGRDGHRDPDRVI